MTNGPNSGIPNYYCLQVPEQPLVPLADGTLFPESLEVQVVVNEEEQGTVVDVELEVQDGHPAVVEVAIRRLHWSSEAAFAPPLTPTSIRSINFGKVFETAIEHGGFMGVGFKNPLKDKPAAVDAARRANGLARRRQPLTPALLAQVVNIVRNNRYDPRKQVASMLYVSERTASRWIAEARKRGLLEESGDLDGDN